MSARRGHNFFPSEYRLSAGKPFPPKKKTKKTLFTINSSILMMSSSKYWLANYEEGIEKKTDSQQNSHGRKSKEETNI